MIEIDLWHFQGPRCLHQHAKIWIGRGVVTTPKIIHLGTLGIYQGMIREQAEIPSACESKHGNRMCMRRDFSLPCFFTEG